MIEFWAKRVATGHAHLGRTARRRQRHLHEVRGGQGEKHRECGEQGNRCTKHHSPHLKCRNHLIKENRQNPLL